ncbi:MAG: proprotein convertase P-domain-containing protein [Saprospiraceae bacterium]|nr:proprotein convertase P-domain-containing protein [Saprospiraceae bacterium]
MSVPQMKSLLAQAPMWHTESATTQGVTVALPMPDGSFQDFRIVEAPIMHPDLQAKYPTLRSYAGQGIDDPLAYFRGDFTMKGFHGMVRSMEHSTVFIDPYSSADVQNYQVYYKKDFSKSDPWQCDFDNVHQENASIPTPPSLAPIGDCQLRDYTLALACTGEYATFHGGTTSAVMSAFVTTMTRVNGVFEQDASVHMTLHPNTNQLIFLNPSTDPYTNTNGSTMLGQNQTTCDNVIGNANYDIGHVFSTGGGGVAYLGAVCSSTIKAGGVTGQSNPIGDGFDIDYVAHEMGHQYGANHTQNNNCNRNASTAMEPGSASTIMGYAGICAPNIQAHSDDYFHAISLQEIAAEVTSNGGGGGNTCSTNTTINSTPTANAGADYVIPKSTPYILTGIGTDPNTSDPIPDILTYTWEQMDFAVATMPPVATSTGGPAFRSFKGSTSPSRYLPRLTDVVNNVSPTWEVLASVGRTLNWRLVVRDNHVGGGCAAQDNMVVTVNGTAGPFVVTAPNTNVSWAANSTQTVTWNVASTTASPVSCANVDIFLSVDGGNSYQYTLATATPNDGSQAITIPNIAANTTSRIMVKANGNIFYDISNTNFTITAATNGFTVNATPGTQSVCSPSSAVYAVAVGAVGSYSGSVTLSVSGLPAGANGTFSANPVPVPPTGNSNLTVTTSGVAAGTYNLTITGNDGSQSQSANVTLTVLAGAPGQAVLSTPADVATGVSQTPTLTWNAVSGAATYDVQVSTSNTFATTVVNATGVTGTSYNVTTPLNANTTYFWHVQAVNNCGAGSYSSTFSFTTASTSCLTQASTDVPKAISANGTPIVTSTLTSAASGTISDVNLLNLGITHTWINDMVVKLKSPAGTEITLFSQICGSEDNVLTNFDDAGLAYSSLPCPPTNNGTYQPLNALSAFNGQNLNGTWTLTAQDVANQDGGSLNSWSLNICYTPGAAPLSVSVTGTNIGCNGGNNGTATATATGGTHRIFIIGAMAAQQRPSVT